MIYKMLPKFNAEDPQIFARIDDDGVCRLTCTEQDQAYLKWVEEGGVVLPANEETQ